MRRTTRRRRPPAEPPPMPAVDDTPQSDVDVLDDGFTLRTAPMPEPVRTRPAKDDDSRISIRLDPSGAVAVDRLSPRIREQLTAALADPHVRQSLGIGPSTQPAAVQFDGTISNVICDALGSIKVALAQRYGYTVQEARVLLYTDAEKQMLEAPLVGTLNDYFGTAAATNLTMLLLSLAMIETGKLSQLRHTESADLFRVGEERAS